MGKWDRMEERMEGKMKRIIEELEGMKKKEEEWRRERERLEKRVVELEKKWGKDLEMEEGERRIKELEQRIKRLELAKRGGLRKGKAEED